MKSAKQMYEELYTKNTTISEFLMLIGMDADEAASIANGLNKTHYNIITPIDFARELLALGYPASMKAGEDVVDFANSSEVHGDVFDITVAFAAEKGLRENAFAMLSWGTQVLGVQNFKFKSAFDMKYTEAPLYASDALRIISALERSALGVSVYCGGEKIHEIHNGHGECNVAEAGSLYYAYPYHKSSPAVVRKLLGCGYVPSMEVLSSVVRVLSHAGGKDEPYWASDEFLEDMRVISEAMDEISPDGHHIDVRAIDGVEYVGIWANE